MVDRTDKFYLTAAEMLVMRVIWLADHDLVLREVVEECNEAYDKGWKPQTVSTYLSHLVQKQFLRMERNGKIYSYHPLIAQTEFMQYDMRNFADYWGLSPAEMLKGYLNVRGYTAQERGELFDLIRDMEKDGSEKEA